MTSSDFWLVGPLPGPDGQFRLHWLTPLEQGHCAFSPPRVDLGPLAAFRHRGPLAAIEDCWPPPTVRALQDLLQRPASGLIRVRIALVAPPAGGPTDAVRGWQRGLFEHLSLGGTPLPRRVVFEREAPNEYDGTPVAVGDGLVLNTWFGTADDEPQQVIPRVGPGVQLRNGYHSVTAELHTNRNLCALSSLAIIAHGACDAKAPHLAHSPFLARRAARDESTEVSWSLPDCTLPPLVIILACSSDRLELVEYARTLLDRGARCVLAPSGRIDASAAARFVAAFLDHWRAGKTVAEVIHFLRDTYWTNLLDRLWIMGSGELRHGVVDRIASPDSLPHLPTRELTALLQESDARTIATAALADRATLRSLQAAAGPRGAMTLLSNNLDYTRCADSDEKGHALLAQLDAAYSSCLAPTRAWLASFLMGLGERYDHEVMNRYRLVPERVAKSTFGTALLMRLTAVADARDGHYLSSARSLARGFEILQGLREDSPLDRLELAATVISHLVDFNLPQSAERLAQRIRRELDALDPDDRSVLEFKLRDRLARIAFRQGDIELALARMLKKFDTARTSGEGGLRELSWLVYFAAWRPGEPIKAHLEWVSQSIQAVREIEAAGELDPAEQPAGNSHLSYLLRALSAWHWARPEQNLGRRLSGWIARAIDQIHRPHADPGPWGFFLAYLAAAGSDDAAREWPTARAQMIDKEYRLETVGLEHLRGLRSADHAEILREFQQTRATLTGILQPALLNSGMIHSADVALLDTECSERDRIEHQVFDSLAAEPAQRRLSLLRSGLAPM